MNRTQRGAALVEFAVMLPIVILILLGIIEIGRFAYFSILVANSAHAGAMYGAQRSATTEDSAGMAAAAVADLGPNPIGTVTPNPAPTWGYQCMSTTTGAVTTAFPATTPCPAGSTGRTYVKVVMTGTITPIFRYPLLPQTFSVTATSLMPVQTP